MTISNWKIPSALYGIICTVIIGAIGIYIKFSINDYKLGQIAPKVERHDTQITTLETKMDIVIQGVNSINAKLDRVELRRRTGQ